VRNVNLLSEGDVVQCQNPNCNASYRVHIESNDFLFERYRFTMECLSCHEKTYIEANALLKTPYTEGRTIVCGACESRHTVHWSLQYSLFADELFDTPQNQS